MQSCGMSMVKYALFIFNLIFAISGIGIIVAGSVVLAGINDYSHFVGSALLAPPIVLIVAGAIVFIIAFLGCFGAIREVYCMLITFAILLIVILIVELAVGITGAVVKNSFEMVLKDTLKQSMANYSINDAEKEVWDKFQAKLQCCGVDSSDDWSAVTGNIPYSCCQEMQEGTEPASRHCIDGGKNQNYLRRMGCYAKLKDRTHGTTNILIAVGITIAFIEIIGIVLACILASRIKEDDAPSA